MRLIIHISPQEFPDSVQPWLRSKVLECRSLGIPWWPTPRLWNKLWKWLGTGCRYQPSKFTLQLHIKWLKRWSIEPCTYFKKFCLSNRSALLIPHYPMSMWKIPGVCDPRRHSAKAVMDLKTCADCVQHHLQQTALATGRKDPANVGILGNRLTWKRWWCMFRVWKWRAREWMPHHGWRRRCRRWWWWWWCSHGNSRELLGYDWLSLDKSKHCIHDFPNFLAKKMLVHWGSAAPTVHAVQDGATASKEENTNSAKFTYHYWNSKFNYILVFPGCHPCWIKWCFRQGAQLLQWKPFC